MYFNNETFAREIINYNATFTVLSCLPFFWGIIMFLIKLLTKKPSPHYLKQKTKNSREEKLKE
jgi:hypothetical protein